jgi:anti-sigma-K factor RskA
MDKDKFLQTGLLEQYILGLTDEQESETVEQYAEAYPEIQKEINSMRSALDQYAQQYAVMPPEELKSRVMKSIEGEARQDRQPQAGESSSLTRISSGLAILLFGVLGVLAAYFYQGRNKAQAAYQNLNAEFELFKQDCANEKARLGETQKVYAFINDPNTTTVTMKGVGATPDAQTVAYYNAATQKAYVNTAKLPAPPAGKTYQIWADVEGEMINMGVLKQESHLQAIRFVDHAESLNITIEPAGGSEEPTVANLFVNGAV